MQEATITVFTITYNCKRYIHRCYQSILNQSYEDWIWLVIDDGSTDETELIFQGINDSRIKYHKLRNNVGRGLARNFGLSKVQTRWIAILDIDDLMLHNRLEKFNSAILDNYIGFISSTLLIDSTLNITGLRNVIYSKYFNLFTHATLCVDVEVLKKVLYSETRYAEDQRVILYISKLKNVYRCIEPLYVYQEDASISVKGAFLSNYYAFLNNVQLIFFENKLKFNLTYIIYLFMIGINTVLLFFLSNFSFGNKIYSNLIRNRVKASFYNQSISKELKVYE